MKEEEEKKDVDPNRRFVNGNEEKVLKE